MSKWRCQTQLYLHGEKILGWKIREAIEMQKMPYNLNCFRIQEVPSEVKENFKSAGLWKIRNSRLSVEALKMLRVR